MDLLQKLFPYSESEYHHLLSLPLHHRHLGREPPSLLAWLASEVPGWEVCLAAGGVTEFDFVIGCFFSSGKVLILAYSPTSPEPGSAFYESELPQT